MPALPVLRHLPLRPMGEVLVVTLDNPPFNTISLAVLDQLDQLLDAVEKEPGIRALVLTSSTPRFFAAGADVGAMVRNSREQVLAYGQRGNSVFDRIERFARPIVAAVNGFALGGGFELALACDIRVLGESARVGLPEVSLGIIPGWGGLQRVARVAGAGRALDLCLTGRMLEARQAVEMGLASSVEPDGELLERALERARTLASRAPLAMRAIKQRLVAGAAEPAAARIAADLQAFLELLDTADAREGLTAFLDKRQPSFEGK
jgi:enoyl-CoA hydratase/carnithine racemase